MPLTVGDRLARYEIRGFLGAGGMGEVYRAHDERLDRDVAIKVLPEGLSQDPDRLRRFEREARAAAALNHPNILDVHDLGEHQGRAFIVTELLEGEPLRAVIASGNLPLRKAVEYGRQIATGLAAAHDAGITHRDLKPANLFLTNEGLIKILDFGLAKLARPETSPEELSISPTQTLQTETGIALGTPGFIAPEQLHGRPADQRSDVFSFGVVLYEMVTGQHPFPGTTIAEIHAAILTEEAPSLSRISPDVPPLLEHLVARCLEKRPEDRFQSARDLLFALEELSTGEVTTRRRRVRSPWLRRASLVAVAVAAVIAAAVIFQRSSHGVPFQERDWLLITDFENLTDDATFDRALDPALTVAIEQSSYINVLSRERIQPVLRQMKRADASEIDEALGRQVARRWGIDVFLVPSISRLGSRYALTASLKDTTSGTTYSSRLVHAEGIDEVLPALDRLSREIRRDLGETLASISDHSEPLVAATTSSLEALEQYSLARDHLHRSDFEGARRLFESALQIDPEFTSAKLSLALLHFDSYMEGRDAEKGARLLNEALEEADTVTDLERFNIRAAHARHVEKNMESAVEMYRTYLSTYPDLPVPHQNLARIYQELGRYDDAVAEYSEALRIDPHLILAYDGLIWLLRNYVGDVDAIIEWATREIAEDENHLWPHLNLCWGYLGKGDGPRAVAAARRAVEIAPGNVWCHYHLGHALQLAEEHLEAARSFETVLALAPHEIWAHFHVGDALEKAGDTEGAHAQFSAYKDAIEKLATDYPEDIDYAIWLDCARIRLGEEPVTTFSSEQLASTDPDFNWYLAQVYSLSGRPKEAIDRLEIALENGAENPIWILCISTLDALHDEPRYQELKRRTLKLGNGLASTPS